MAKKSAPITNNLEPAEAFRLGFYTRHFDEHESPTVVRRLRAKVPPALFEELKQAVNGLRRVNSSRDRDVLSLATAADRVLGSSHPVRTLYNLGAAFGVYVSPRSRSTDTPDARDIWDCVQSLPSHLIRDGGYFALRNEANEGHNLEAVLERLLEQREVDVLADAEDLAEDLESRAEYIRLASKLPRFLRAQRGSLVARFVGEVSRELTTIGGIPSRSPTTDSRRALSPCQQELVDVIATAGHRLSGEEIFDAIGKKGRIASEGTTKIYLAFLVKAGYLTNRRDVTPSGYGLPDWD